MDGDCALIDGFAITAADALSSDPKIGVVTGQCLEQHPEASIYNRLCAMEWDGPVGEIKACGGIFMTRVGVFASVGGFNESIIAAEDDDFCIRVRNRGSRIVRIDHPMCLHDADMHRFGQWWRRMERAGHAFAQLGDMHGRYFQAERLRSWGWGFVLPALAFIGAPLTGGLSLLLLFLYPASFLRTRSGLIKRGRSQKDATLGAAFLTLAKFPNLLGMIRYRWRKIAGTGIGIIEYK